MLLADVNMGTHTPTYIGGVMQWRKAQPEEGERMWSKINSLNLRLYELYQTLNQLYQDDATEYAKVVEDLSQRKIEEVSRLEMTRVMCSNIAVARSIVTDIKGAASNSNDHTGKFKATKNW